VKEREDKWKELYMDGDGPDLQRRRADGLTPTVTISTSHFDFVCGSSWLTFAQRMRVVERNLVYNKPAETELKIG
jgi:acyl dehydratase